MTPSEASSRDHIGHLFKLNYAWLCARVRSRTGCPHSAEDIAAETFARILRLPDPSLLREPRALLLAGPVDNRTLNVLLSYSHAGHTLGVAYQGLSGSTAMPYLIGTDAYLTNYMMAADFMETCERTWQLRYAYDFVALGLTGLTFWTRYNRADHANPATFAGEGHEWERDTDLGYTIQSGPLKNVNVVWRNAALRSNYQRDIDENRLIVSYTMPLF